MRSKLKNYITGNVLEKTFRAGESLQAAQIEKRDCQYTYVDGDFVSLSITEVCKLFSCRHNKLDAPMLLPAVAELAAWLEGANHRHVYLSTKCS